MAKRAQNLPVLDELILEPSVPLVREPPRPPQAEDWDVIFDYVSENMSLQKACKELNIHYPSVTYRIRENERLQREYNFARANRAEILAEKAIDIAEDVASGLIEPGPAKTAAGIYQWASAQLNPKDWGQSTVRQEITGPGGKELQQVVIFALPDNSRSQPMRDVTPKALPEPEE